MFCARICHSEDFLEVSSPFHNSNARNKMDRFQFFASWWLEESQGDRGSPNGGLNGEIYRPHDLTGPHPKRFDLCGEWPPSPHLAIHVIRLVKYDQPVGFPSGSLAELPVGPVRAARGSGAETTCDGAWPGGRNSKAH